MEFKTSSGTIDKQFLEIYEASELKTKNDLLFIELSKLCYKFVQSREPLNETNIHIIKEICYFIVNNKNIFINNPTTIRVIEESKILTDILFILQNYDSLDNEILVFYCLKFLSIISTITRGIREYFNDISLIQQLYTELLYIFIEKEKISFENQFYFDILLFLETFVEYLPEIDFISTKFNHSPSNFLFSLKKSFLKHFPSTKQLFTRYLSIIYSLNQKFFGKNEIFLLIELIDINQDENTINLFITMIETCPEISTKILMIIEKYFFNFSEMSYKCINSVFNIMKCIINILNSQEILKFFESNFNFLKEMTELIKINEISNNIIEFIIQTVSKTVVLDSKEISLFDFILRTVKVSLRSFLMNIIDSYDVYPMKTKISILIFLNFLSKISFDCSKLIYELFDLENIIEMIDNDNDSLEVCLELILKIINVSKIISKEKYEETIDKIMENGISNELESLSINNNTIGELSKANLFEIYSE